MRVAHPERRIHRAVVIAGILLVAFVGACKGKDKGTPDSTSAPPDTTVGADSAAARDSAQKAILDLGIPGAPGETDESRAYLTRVHYADTGDPLHEASEIIDEDVDCNAGNTVYHSHLKILPVHYAHEIPWGKVAASKRSHLYAKIVVSKANCPNLGLKNTLAYSVGYLALGDDGAGALIARVFRKTPTGVIDTGISSNKITYCITSTPAKPGAHLYNPVHCTQTTTPYAASGGTGMVKPRLVLASMLPTANFMAVFLDSGLWVSCSTGCCEVHF